MDYIINGGRKMKTPAKKKAAVISKTAAVKHKGPRIIALVCTKGGVGKSTIAFNLAVELSKKADVSVIDLDYQKSLTIFDYNRRELGMEPFKLLTIKGAKELKKVLTDTSGTIIIDTHAIDSDLTRLAIIAADVVLTPTTDGYLDLCGLLAFKNVIQDIRKIKKGLKAHVIINRLAARSTGYKDVETFVEDHKDCFKIVKARLTSRQEYRDAFEQGKSVCEMGEKKVAADEFKKLLKEIESL
jgi:chromosome partitioning protein